MPCPPVRHVCRCDRSLRRLSLIHDFADGNVPKNDPGKIWVLWETPEVRSGEKDKVLYCYGEEEEEKRKEEEEECSLSIKSQQTKVCTGKMANGILKSWETDYIRIDIIVVIKFEFLGH